MLGARSQTSNRISIYESPYLDIYVCMCTSICLHYVKYMHIHEYTYAGLPIHIFVYIYMVPPPGDLPFVVVLSTCSKGSAPKMNFVTKLKYARAQLLM